jgi:hypothetical protein
VLLPSSSHYCTGPSSGNCAPSLLKPLEEELEDYPGLVFDEGILAIHEPFDPLLHYWDSLERKSRSEYSGEVTSEIINVCHGLDKLWKWKCMCFGINMYE